MVLGSGSGPDFLKKNYFSRILINFPSQNSRESTPEPGDSKKSKKTSNVFTSEFRSLNRCFSPSGELHPALEMLRGASLTPRNRLELILKTQKNRVPAA